MGLARLGEGRAAVWVQLMAVGGEPLAPATPVPMTAPNTVTALTGIAIAAAIVTNLRIICAPCSSASPRM